MYQSVLADVRLFELLGRIDQDLARVVQGKGCGRCGGRLDRADYARKPRGMPAEHRDPSLHDAESPGGSARTRDSLLPKLRELHNHEHAGRAQAFDVGQMPSRYIGACRLEVSRECREEISGRSQSATPLQPCRCCKRCKKAASTPITVPRDTATTQTKRRAVMLPSAAK